MEKIIIPTIFSTDTNTFNKKLNVLKDFTKNIHLDFMDGEFVDNKSIQINEMKEILKYPKINFQIHLMAKNPIQYLDEIKTLKIKKVIIHFSSVKNKLELDETIKQFKKNNIKVVLCLNPDEDSNLIEQYSQLISEVMLMAVWPGKEGQKFIEEIYQKASQLRNKYLNMNIQVDGGVKDENLKKIINSGINIINIGSYITSSNAPKENYEKLQKLVIS